MNDNFDVRDTEQTERTGAENENPKMFTEEEVEKIIQRRLARDRRNRKPAQEAELQAGKANHEARERDLNARELKIMAKEQLQAAGLPLSLADVLKYEDQDTLEEAIEKILEINQKSQSNKAKTGSWGQRHSEKGPLPSADSKIRSAMGLG